MAGSIEERLRAVEDTFEIINLKSTYWNGCDGGWDRPSHNGDVVAALFVEDGVWEILDGQAPGHKATGRAAIRDAFNRTYNKDVPFAFHHGGSPIIRVKGDTATGEWHLMGLLTAGDGTPLLAAIYYRDQFVRTAEGWRIASMTLTPVFVTPFKEGWGGLKHLTAK